MQHGKKLVKRLSCKLSWNEYFSLLLCYFKHYIECLPWIENVSWGNIMKSFSAIWAVIWNWEKSIKKSRKKWRHHFLASSLLPEHSATRGQKLTFKTYGNTLAPPLYKVTRLADRSVTIAGPAAWNSFPICSRNIESHDTFCRQQKTYRYLFFLPGWLMYL